MGRDDENTDNDLKIRPKPGQLPVNQETLDILVANIIPTSKYFEARFDNLESHFAQHQHNFENFRGDIDKRFEHIDKRFDDFKSDIDKRFEQMILSIDRLTDKLDHRDEQQRSLLDDN